MAIYNTEDFLAEAIDSVINQSIGFKDVELILVPNTQVVTEKDAVYVSSDDIKNFINEKTKMVSVQEITSSTQSKVDNNTTNQ